MDSQTLSILQSIEGTDTKRSVGKELRVQEDSDNLQRGYRIWYSTEDKIYAASYTFYDSDVIFEDEIASYPVAGGIDSTIGKYQDNFIFTSVRDESYIDVYSLTACPSGYEFSFEQSASGVKSLFGCSKCEEDLFSTGFTGCQECSFWERFNTENSYKKNIIDNTCEYKKVVDNEEKEETIEGL